MFCGPKTIRHGKSGMQNIVKAVELSHDFITSGGNMARRVFENSDM